MLSYTLSKNLDDRLKKLDELIAEKYNQILPFSSEKRSALQRYALITTIGASTRIENAVLTDCEVAWVDTILSRDGKTTAFENNQKLIFNKLSKDRERSIEEVAGTREMLQLIYHQAKDLIPLTESQMRGLHHVLLQYYPNAHHYLGQYKNQSNSVIEHNHATNETRIVFETANPGPITNAAMTDLIKWYNEHSQTNHATIAISCEFIFRFLAIHPFQDSNGRMSRGLFILSLLQSPQIMLQRITPYLAIDRHIEQHKSEYYRILNNCSNGKFSLDPTQYHIEYFLQFMIKIITEALNDIEIYQKRFDIINDLSQSAKRMLDCFKEFPEIHLTTKRLCEETQLPRRTINYILKTLLHAQLIQRYGKGAGTHYQLIF